MPIIVHQTVMEGGMGTTPIQSGEHCPWTLTTFLCLTVSGG